MAESVGGVTSTTRHLWCGDRICQSRTGADNVTRRHYPEGEHNVTTGQKLLYRQDQLGSVRDVTDATTGNLVAAYDYGPYGNITRTWGTASTDYRYAGLFYHPQSGLNLATYRAYDTATGRWINRDPIREAGGIPLYGYVGGNPVNYTDPQGLVALPLLWYVGVALAGGEAGYIGSVFQQLYQNGGDATAINQAQALSWARFGGEALAMGAMMPPISRPIGLVGTETTGQCTVPSYLTPTLDRIAAGQKFPHIRDGSNFMNREGLLPMKPSGYYKEYVHPTSGVKGPGAQRVVTGANGEIYYTPDHYHSFIQIK